MSQEKNVPDAEELIEKAARRDRRAIELLLAEYLPAARAIVSQRMTRALRAHEESVDLVQSACLRALEQRSLAPTAEGPRFRAWLLRIIENKLVDRYRELTSLRRGRDLAPRADDEHDVEHAFSSADRTPSAYAAKNETIVHVQRAMRELPTDLRQALELHELEGLSYERIAERLGLTLKQARYRVAKAKVKLSPILRAHLLGPESDDRVA